MTKEQIRQEIVKIVDMDIDTDYSRKEYLETYGDFSSLDYGDLVRMANRLRGELRRWNEKTSGFARVNEDMRFGFVTGNGDGEVRGWIEKYAGGFVPGASGWYRTNVPSEAMETAVSLIELSMSN